MTSTHTPQTERDGIAGRKIARRRSPRRRPRSSARRVSRRRGSRTSPRAPAARRARSSSTSPTKEERCSWRSRASSCCRASRGQQIVESHQGTMRELLVKLIRARWDAIACSNILDAPEAHLLRGGELPRARADLPQRDHRPQPRPRGRVLREGVARGEFREMDVSNVARAAVAPVLMAALWKHVRAAPRELPEISPFFETSLDPAAARHRAPNPPEVTHEALRTDPARAREFILARAAEPVRALLRRPSAWPRSRTPACRWRRCARRRPRRSTIGARCCRCLGPGEHDRPHVQPVRARHHAPERAGRGAVPRAAGGPVWDSRRGSSSRSPCSTGRRGRSFAPRLGLVGARADGGVSGEGAAANAALAYLRAARAGRSSRARRGPRPRRNSGSAEAQLSAGTAPQIDVTRARTQVASTRGALSVRATNAIARASTSRALASAVGDVRSRRRSTRRSAPARGARRSNRGSRVRARSPRRPARRTGAAAARPPRRPFATAAERLPRVDASSTGA